MKSGMPRLLANGGAQLPPPTERRSSLGEIDIAFGKNRGAGGTLRPRQYAEPEIRRISG
jgi:hypothetical protein